MKKLLILDIDETLVHALKTPLERDHDFKTDLYFVYKRPYVDEFISYCCRDFKVAVWTTGGKEYAEAVVGELFPTDYRPEFVWSLERCTPVPDPLLFETVLMKKLYKVKRQGYLLEQIIMIDDTPEKLAGNYGNLVQVKEYRGEEDDDELLKLMQYLDTLKEVDNIRKVEKRDWRKKIKLE